MVPEYLWVGMVATARGLVETQVREYTAKHGWGWLDDHTDPGCSDYAFTWGAGSSRKRMRQSLTLSIRREENR